MTVERRVIASEQKHPLQISRGATANLLRVLVGAVSGGGLTQKKLAGFTTAARLDTERQVALSGFRYKTALDGCLRHRLPAR